MWVHPIVQQILQNMLYHVYQCHITQYPMTDMAQY